jgi:hypothetical protein
VSSEERANTHHGRPHWTDEEGNFFPSFLPGQSTKIIVIAREGLTSSVAAFLVYPARSFASCMSPLFLKAWSLIGTRKKLYWRNFKNIFQKYTMFKKIQKYTLVVIVNRGQGFFFAKKTH